MKVVLAKDASPFKPSCLSQAFLQAAMVCGLTYFHCIHTNTCCIGFIMIHYVFCRFKGDGDSLEFKKFAERRGGGEADGKPRFRSFGGNDFRTLGCCFTAVLMWPDYARRFGSKLYNVIQLYTIVIHIKISCRKKNVQRPETPNFTAGLS